VKAMPQGHIPSGAVAAGKGAPCRTPTALLPIVRLVLHIYDTYLERKGDAVPGWRQCG
jgi:hypothetical protein